MIRIPVAFALLALAAAPLSHAATIHVPGDQPTIQAGIDAATFGDTVLVACGTYYESRIELWAGVTLLSETGDPACAVIDARGDQIDFQGIHPVIIVPDFPSIAIQGFTIRGGTGGGISCEQPTTRVQDCIIEDNAGPGLSFFSPDPNTANPGGVENCIFRNNTGGGVRVYNGTARVIGCTFEANETEMGGGIRIDRGPDVLIRDCVFRNNAAGTTGGGVYLVYTSAVVEDCLFDGNTTGGGCCVYDGAGLNVKNDCDVSLRRCIFVNNEALGFGGGVLISASATALVEDCLFVGNRASSGGGAAVTGYAQASFIGCTFSDNWASNGGNGGGIVCRDQGGPVDVTRSVFAFNSGGAAIWCWLFECVAMTVECTNVFGNVGGDWVGCLLDQAGINGNFSADPVFCDAANGDFSLSSNSPCLPGNHPNGVDCGPIGALGVGCGPVSVELESWTRIKSRWR